MNLRRVPIDPATFAAVDRGDQHALVLLDEGIQSGDDVFLVQTLGGMYQGGTKLLHVTHVLHAPEVAEGYCIASVRALGPRGRA